MTTTIETYVPKIGSLPWRVIKHLQENPSTAELSRRQIGDVFAVDNTGSLDTLLQIACARSVLVKGRNRVGDVTWRLGTGHFQILTTQPIERTPAAPMVPTGAPLAPAIATKWVTVEPHAEPSAEPDPAPPPAPAAEKTDGVDMDRVYGRSTATPPAQTAPAAPAPAIEPAPEKQPSRLPRMPFMAPVRTSAPIVSAKQAEQRRYDEWLERFAIGDSAEFRRAQLPAVRAAAAAFARISGRKFRIEAVSRYRAGIERTA